MLILFYCLLSQSDPNHKKHSFFFWCKLTRLCLGDPYKKAKANIERKIDAKQIKDVHDKMFAPAKIVKVKVKAPYEH